MGPIAQRNEKYNSGEENKLSFLGLDLDEEKNAKNYKSEITKRNSKLKMFVIPTNEKLQMVRGAKVI
jgi:acetate kinase